MWYTCLEASHRTPLICIILCLTSQLKIKLSGRENGSVSQALLQKPIRPYFRPSELTQTHRHKCLTHHSLPDHGGRDRRIYRSSWVSEPGISAESERPCFKQDEIWEPTLNAWDCPLIPTCAPWHAHTHHIHTRIDLRVSIKGPSTNSQSSFMAGDQSNWLTEPWSDVKASVRMQWINDSIGTVIVMKTRGTQTPGTAVWSEPYGLWNTDLRLENSV